MVKYLLICFLCVVALHASAQKQVSGIIVSQQTNEPLAWVMVYEPGTQNSVFSEVNGSFSIQVTDTSQFLELSFVGYQTTFISTHIAPGTIVQMQTDAVTLSAITIQVPYGLQTKETFTGSMDVVSSEQIASQAYEGIDRVLQGRVPGLQITGASGQPGAATEIQLRGAGSMSASSQPLIVIDGIPVYSGQLSQATAHTNALSTINPQDIASISILKDASATSLYGSRASNGVILITTKSGTQDRQSYSFSTSQGIGTVAYNNFSPLSAGEYKQIQAEGMRNAGMTDAEIAIAQLADTANTDWFSEVFRPAHTQQYEFVAQGGNEHSRYYLSTALLDDKGIVDNTGLRRFSVRLSVDNNPNKKLRYGIRLAPSSTNQQLTEAPGILSSPVTGVFLAPPTYAMRNDAQYNFSQGFYNPVGSIMLNQNTAKTMRLLGNAYVEYRLPYNMQYKTIVQADRISLEEFIFRHPATPDGSLVGGIGEHFTGERTTTTTSSTITWRKSYDFIHNFNVLGGVETESIQQTKTRMKASQFPFADVTSLHAASKLEEINTYTEEEALVSFFSNTQYNYKSKYFLSFSYRTDGSSKFSPQNRWGHFWSLGGSWLIHREQWMQENFRKISLFKLRVSYGTSGNSEIPNYKFLNLYSYGNNYTDLPGTFPSEIGNPHLTWEKNRSLNIGFDVNISRFTTSLELYHRYTYDLLLNVPIPMTSGYKHQLQNVGALSNRGVELKFESKNIQHEHFVWTTGLNYALNMNRIEELYSSGQKDTIIQGTKIRTEGESLQSFYLPHWAGVNQADGSAMWYDADGNLTRDYNMAAYVTAGRAEPIFTAGITNDICYKQFGFGAFLYINYGNIIFNQLQTDLNSDGAIMGKNQSTQALDRWQNPGDNAASPQFVQNNGSNSNAFSTRYLENGSYIRLQNIYVRYAIPSEKLEALKLQSCNVSFQINNVWVWSQFSGMDPETRTSGVYYYDYPKQRLYSIGVQVGF